MLSLLKTPRLLLAAFAVAAALFALPAVAGAVVSPSTFEGNDGQQKADAGTDWQTAVSSGAVTTIPDTGGTNSQYTGGKEEEPNDWDLIDEPAGGVSPSKSDFKDVFVSSETTLAPAKNFLYLAFFRGMPASGSATTFLTFELNQVFGVWKNSHNDLIPCRSNGDVMFSYQISPGGATPIDIIAYTWVGDANSGPSGSTGAGTLATGCPNGGKGTWSGGSTILSSGLAEGKVNFAAPDGPGAISPANDFLLHGGMNAETFGEASINLSDTFTALGLNACQSFGSVQAHSRSSNSFTSAMQDLVTSSAPVFIRSCTVSGHKFNDQNADHTDNGGTDPGLAGFTFYVDYNGDGVKDANEPSAVSDANGDYTITGVNAGSWKVREDLSNQSGWTCTFPQLDDGKGCYTQINITTGGNVPGVDFGNSHPLTISGTKYEDSNADGDQDAGEPALVGWRIYVDENGNGSYDAGEPNSITDANGHYSLSAPQSDIGRKLHEEVTNTAANSGAAWHCSQPNNATNGGTDCNVTIAAPAAGFAISQDFGNYRDATVTGTKYEDRNADGHQGAGELGLSGWHIYLDTNGNGSFDAGEPDDTTDVKGGYAIVVSPAANGSDLREDAAGSAGAAGATWHCSQPANAANGGTDCFTTPSLSSGALPTQDFGNYRDVSLSGKKYEDLNANGTHEAGEPYLVGWRVYVDENANSSFDAGEANGVTDANGDYSFTASPAVFPADLREEVTGAAANNGDSWYCSEPGNAAQGTDCSVALTSASGDSVSQTFGNYRKGTVVIKKVNDGGPAADTFGFDASQALSNASTPAPALGGSAFALPGGGTQAFNSVKPSAGGTYTVTEASKAGYRLVSISCSDGDSTDAAAAGGLANKTATLKVESGESLLCTFTNKSIKSSAIVVKAGDDHVYHGDTMHFTFTVTNTGDGPLSNVTLGDDKCPNVQGPSKQEGPNNSGAAFLDPGDVWTYTCSKAVPDHAAGEENPIVNIATVNATDEFGRPVTDTDSHSTRVLHPAIALDKTGPAQATQGDLVPYTLNVTNPGDESFAADTVVVADQQCAVAPGLQAKNTGASPDATPGSLDPGDTWVYTCSVQTVKGPAAIDNIATVHAADQFGHPVDATGTAHTVLGEQIVAGEQVEPGTAKLAGASGCVARKFIASVRGKQIKKVVFSIDGKKRASVSKPDSSGRYKLVVDPRKFKPGSHLLAARTTFIADSATKAKTMKLRFSRCIKRVAPAFTG